MFLSTIRFAFEVDVRMLFAVRGGLWLCFAGLSLFVVAVDFVCV